MATYPVKFLAVSADPNVMTEMLEKEEHIFSLDPALYKFYEIEGPDIREISYWGRFMKTPANINTLPNPLLCPRKRTYPI
jgi:hypothetical protein